MTVFLISGDTLKLTLKKAETFALNNNPEILQEAKKLEQAKSKTRLAYSSFLPSLDASGNRVLKEKVMTIEMPSFIPGQPPRKIEMDFTRNYQLTLQFMQPLFTGGKLIFGLNTARAMEKAEQSLLQAKKDEIRAKTKAMFYSIILLEKSLKIIRDGLKLAVDTKNSIKESYKQGLVKKLDLLRAENRVREIEVQKREIESKIIEAKNRFKNLLGINLDKNILIVGKIIEKRYNIDLEILKKELIENNPILSSMNNRIKAVKNGVRMAYSNFLPTIAIGGQYNFRGDSLGNFSSWDNYYSINLTLSFSLFKGFSKKYKLAAAKAQKDEAEIGAIALEKNLLAELNNAVKRDHYLKAKIVLQKANYVNTKEEYDIASLSYKEGIISYTDLELIQNKYLTSQLNYYKAIYEYYSNIFKIESLISKNIFK
jgi:outer membrane protein TolC